LSCAHPVGDVTELVPVTFVHEFQHMISFNQHFLKHCTPSGCPVPPEDLWLNEGLSHYAEELGGRTYLPTDTVSYCRHVWGDLTNAGRYSLRRKAVFSRGHLGIGSIAARGAYWLFVRYLVDQFATDTSFAGANAFTRKLEQTTLTGVANVSAATGVAFPTLVERWGLTNYVADLPGFSTPPELRYVKWHFRSDFPLLRATCPNPRTGTPPNPNIPAAFTLVPPVINGSAQVMDTLRAGSGSYYRLQQAAGRLGSRCYFKQCRWSVTHDAGPAAECDPTSVMKRRHDGVTRRFLVTLLCNAGVVSSLSAQAGSLLALAPGSARAAGMGGPGAAIVGDAGGIFANPRRSPPSTTSPSKHRMRRFRRDLSSRPARWRCGSADSRGVPAPPRSGRATRPPICWAPRRSCSARESWRSGHGQIRA